MISPDTTEPNLLWVDGRFWALDFDDGNLIPVHSEEDLYTPGGATIVDVSVALERGRPLYHTMMSQEDSVEGSNYEIVVEGVVRDDLGQPIPDANVYMASLDTEEVIERNMTTDSEGQFQTRVPRRRSTVLAEKDYYEMLTNTSRYVDQSNPFAMSIVLERRISVRGTVTEQNGDPLADVHVDFLHQETGEEYNAITNSEGRFETPFMRPGVYDVTAYVDVESIGIDTLYVMLDNPNVLAVEVTSEEGEGVYDIQVEQLARTAVIQSDPFPTNQPLGWTGSFVLKNAAGTRATVTISNPQRTTLADYASAINQQASSVAHAYVSSGRLVLEAAQSGLAGDFVWDSSSDPDLILYFLGIVDQPGLTLTKNNPTATRAEFYVNGTKYTRSKNTGITDVINNLSLDFHNTGEVTLNVDVIRDQGSETVSRECTVCVVSYSSYGEALISTPGPVTISWDLRPGPRALLITHGVHVEITGPNGFRWQQSSVSDQGRKTGSTTIVINESQTGRFRLEARLAAQTYARVTVSWDHIIHNIRSSNPHIVNAKENGVASNGSYRIRVEELAGKEIVSGRVFDPSMNLRWTGNFTVNGRTVVISDPNATRLQDYANAINSQAGDMVVASVENGKLRITSRSINSSLSFTDPDRILLRLGILVPANAPNLVTKNKVQAGLNSSVRIDGNRITHDSNVIPDAIPGMTLTLLETGHTTMEAIKLPFQVNPYGTTEFELDVQGDPSNHFLHPYQEQNIVLERSFVARGRVLDDRGLPVPDAELRIEHLVTGNVIDSTSHAGARTDANGNFFVPGVDQGQVRITVSHDGGKEWMEDTHWYIYN